MDNELYRFILALVLTGLVLFTWQYYRDYYEEKTVEPPPVNQHIEKAETKKTIIRKDLSKYKNCGRLKIVVYPVYKSMEFIDKRIKNPGISLIIITLIIRILLAPLMFKQVHVSKKMAALQGKIKKIKKIYNENPLEMQKTLGRLFKDNDVNPFGSFGLVILQIPIFIALYKIVREGNIFSGAPFGLWIRNLGVPDPYYVLPVIAGLMMFLGTRFSGGTGTQMPKGLLYIFPIFCTAFLLNEPAGLALYFLAGSVFQLGMNVVTNKLPGMSAGNI
ncbi:YidC/Oxa1 family membrane protein insertase [Thermodesulfobacteriota bacterium]